ncbi:MAG: methyltransferase domain-containing protein [Actinophytocola sp.]|nr:methyltransferase domain-containing protein [Actinophytocola sp.]
MVPHEANLSRSVALFRAFRSEQSDPDRFYGALADDSARQVASYAPLRGATLLDVGGGPGYFADAFEAAGARYVGIDPDVGELSARGDMRAGMLLGSGTELPIRTSTVDVCYSSNVLEHVVRPDADVILVDTLPRYHPSWAKWIVRIPGLREIASWNLAMILRKR